MPTPNWGKLYLQGRCKEIGVPWNDEELHALHELNIPVEFVRDGVLEVEEFEKLSAKDEKKGTPLSRMNRGELLKRTEELEITGFTNATTDAALRDLIVRAEESSKKETPKKKAAPKKVAKKKTAKKATSKKK